jgi:SAM-dependent methyltransferase
VLPDSLVHAGSWCLDRTLPARRANRAATKVHEEAIRVAAALIERNGPIVQGGPFAGMRLPAETSWGFLPPLLVGSYEEELHPIIEELIATAPTRIIDVGCAEGYYAVGLARRLPQADAYAFDIDPRAQLLAGETAKANAVDERVHIGGRCTAERLNELITTETFVIVDCEGCETELLRPDRAPSLRRASVLVELHDFIDPRTSSVVLRRFRETHSIDLIPARERIPTDYPAVRQLNAADRVAAVAELRPALARPMEWAVLRPLA